VDANLKFSDFITRLGRTAIGAIGTGTTSGPVLPLANVGSARKYIARALMDFGSAAATASLFLQTASVSSGTFASLSAAAQSVAVTGSGSLWELAIDLRNEYFSDLGSSAVVVQPVLVITGAGVNGVLEILGYDVANMQPANAAGYGVTEKLVY
jgi:hypothetical protein